MRQWASRSDTAPTRVIVWALHQAKDVRDEASYLLSEISKLNSNCEYLFSSACKLVNRLEAESTMMTPEAIDELIAKQLQRSITRNGRLVSALRARSTCSKRTALQRKPIKFGQWPPSPLKVVLGATAMGTLLVVFAIQRVPGDERIVVEKPSIPTVEPRVRSGRTTEESRSRTVLD